MQIYWNKRERLHKKRTPTGLVWDTNMAAVSLFWDTNMAAATSGEDTLFAKTLGRGQKKGEKRSRALPLHGSCFDVCWTVLLLVSSFIIQPIVLAFL